jgi:hypothetical protein
MKYSPEILSTFPMHMCHTTVTYKGRETIMTPAMEQILCEGRNFEHSHGAVHGSKLETLFSMYSTWNLVVKQFVADVGKQVCCLYFVFKLLSLLCSLLSLRSTN